MKNATDYHFDEWELFWSGSLFNEPSSYKYFQTEQEARDHATTALTERGVKFEDVGNGQYSPSFGSRIYCRISHRWSKEYTVEYKRNEIAKLRASIATLESEIAAISPAVPPSAAAFDPSANYVKSGTEWVRNYTPPSDDEVRVLRQYGRPDNEPFWKETIAFMGQQRYDDARWTLFVRGLLYGVDEDAYRISKAGRKFLAELDAAGAGPDGDA